MEINEDKYPVYYTSKKQHRHQAQRRSKTNMKFNEEENHTRVCKPRESGNTFPPNYKFNFS